MKNSRPDNTSAGQLATVIPILRGLLSESTGDEDIPFAPPILRSLTSDEAVDFARSEENAKAGRYPDGLSKGKNPPLFVGALDQDTEADELRKQLGKAI